MLVGGKRHAAIANLSFNMAAVAVNVVIGLLMVPLYLRHMDVAAYGAWLASGGIVAMLGLCESGLATVLTQRLAACAARAEASRFAQFAGTGMVCAAALGFVATALGAVFAWYAPRMVGAPEAAQAPLRWAVVLASAGLGTMMLGYTLCAIPQAWQRTTAAGAMLVLAMGGNVAGILVALAQGWGVTAFGVGSLCQSLLYVLGLGFVVWSGWRKAGLPRPSFGWPTCRELWREARSLLLGRAAAAVGTNLQAPAAAIAVSAEASAVLVLTGRVLSLVPMVVDRVGSAVFAGMAYVSGRSRAERSACAREVVAIASVLAGVGIGLGVCFSQPVVELWVGKEMFGGRKLLLLLALSYLLNVRQNLVSNVLMAFGGIRKASRWMMMDAGVRLSLLVAMAGVFGLHGIPVAYAVAGSAGVAFLSRVLSTDGLLSPTDLWAPGATGLLIALAMSTGWMYLGPTASAWTEVLLQASLCLATTLVLTLVFDMDWRNAVAHNIRSLAHGVGLIRVSAS
ncbi:MAG: hypothetical protein FJ280_16225 [Planctomycetes bacterium]|nr:hypothetical protein [Verrucomicrobiota bacterium]MBM4026926.1 hypothetical protein [Planctomycetota bacterium]